MFPTQCDRYELAHLIHLVHLENVGYIVVP